MESDAGARVDDRGEPVRERPLRAGACPTLADPVVRGALARHRTTLASTWILRYLQAVAVLATFGLGIAAGAWVEDEFGDRVASEIVTFLVGFALAILPAVLLMLAALRGERRFRRVAYRNLLLGVGRCPGCGFAIGGSVQATNDGCMACGECGAAWRADRIAPITVDEANAWQAARFSAAIRGASQHVSSRRDSRGQRVVPSASIFLPRHGPWGVGSLTTFTLPCATVGAIVLCVMLVVMVSICTALVSALFHGTGRDEPVSFVAVLILLVPALFIVPVASATRCITALRLKVLLCAGLCPACESPFVDDATRAPMSQCRYCNAVWKR